MSGGSKKKSKKNASENEPAMEETSSNPIDPLVRDETKRSINPRSILTAFYQKNGKRVQHTVHDGALQMPKDALEVIQTATTHEGSSQETYELPGLDSVVRPCLDPKLSTMIVTELFLEKIQIQKKEDPKPPVLGPDGSVLVPGVEGAVKMIKSSRTAAKTRTIRRIPITAPAERIRGGGDDPNPPPEPKEGVVPMEVDSQPAKVPEIKPLGTASQVSTEAPAPSTVAMGANPPAAPVPTAPTVAALAVPQPTASVETTATPADASKPAGPTTTPIPSEPVSAPVPPPTKSAVPPAPETKPEAPTTTVTPSSALSSEAPKSAPPPEASSSKAQTAKPAPPPVSKTPVKEETKKVEEPEAKILASKPPSEWEQHKSGPNDETVTPQDQLPPRPKWFQKESVHEIERTMLPEWFNGTSPHRTPETYLKTRTKILEISEGLLNRNVTNAMIRRSVVGDAGSLQRLRSFLVHWGIINRDGINDTAPTSAALRPDLKKRPSGGAKFSDTMKANLVVAVTEQASKKRKLESSAPMTIDWDDIASQVGNGASPEDCKQSFLNADLHETPAPNNQNGGLAHLSKEVDPAVLQKVLEVAFEATDGDLSQTQASSILGIHASQALQTARGHEIDLAVMLSKLLETRMQKLEHRMTMLDDVEAILEAEKVALELERRDLYTARCRHWFGGV